MFLWKIKIFELAHSRYLFKRIVGKEMDNLTKECNLAHSFPKRFHSPKAQPVVQPFG